MVATYSPDNPSVRDYVRLLIGDTDTNNATFSDAELDMFLNSAIDYDARLGAAAALESLASKYAMAVGVVKILDVTADGSKVAAELRARAAELRRQYEEDPEAFDVIEWPTGDFAQRERLEDEFLRKLT